MRSKACQERCSPRGSELFSGDGWSGGHERQDFDFVGGADAVVVEIGERELRAGLVGRILDVGLPVGFRGGEVELLFVFEGAQGIEVGVARLSLDQVSQRGASLAWRSAESDCAVG